MVRQPSSCKLAARDARPSDEVANGRILELVEPRSTVSLGHAKLGANGKIKHTKSSRVGQVFRRGRTCRRKAHPNAVPNDALLVAGFPPRRDGGASTVRPAKPQKHGPQLTNRQRHVLGMLSTAETREDIEARWRRGKDVVDIRDGRAQRPGGKAGRIARRCAVRHGDLL